MYRNGLHVGREKNDRKSAVAATDIHKYMEKISVKIIFFGFISFYGYVDKQVFSI